MELPGDDSRVVNLRRKTCTCVSFSVFDHINLEQVCPTEPSDMLHNLMLMSRPGLVNIGSREGDCGECHSLQPMQQKQVCTPVTLVLIKANEPSDNTAIIRYIMVTICSSLCHQDQSCAYNFCARSKD